MNKKHYVDDHKEIKTDILSRNLAAFLKNEKRSETVLKKI